MGYKLAGYNVLGGVEIDPEMAGLYRKNHKPLHSYVMGVGDFNKIPDSDVPAALRKLDILDGSPPCSVFSTANAKDGGREAKWGKARKFREGQAVQVLDDLFFDFLDTVEKLDPKVVVAENVRGMILGNAKGYVDMVMKRFDQLEYDAQLFLLNAAAMGVPQKRQRVFFIARKRSLGWDDIKLEFNEPIITVEDAWKDLDQGDLSHLYMKKDSKIIRYWKNTAPGRSMAKAAGGSNFNNMKLAKNDAGTTITSSAYFTHHTEPRKLSDMEYVRLQTFPDDYDFGKQRTQYVCGMSVPPYMMNRVADAIARQWFGR